MILLREYPTAELPLILPCRCHQLSNRRIEVDATGYLVYLSTITRAIPDIIPYLYQRHQAVCRTALSLVHVLGEAWRGLMRSVFT